jgi:hypothetical protein
MMSCKVMTSRAESFLPFWPRNHVCENFPSFGHRLYGLMPGVADHCAIWQVAFNRRQPPAAKQFFSIPGELLLADDSAGGPDGLHSHEWDSCVKPMFLPKS